MEAWTDTSLDSVCAHCPSIKPKRDSRPGADGTRPTTTRLRTAEAVVPTEDGGGTSDSRCVRAVGDGICLHAFAYSSPEWSYTCPAALTPEWAAALPEEVWERLRAQREAAVPQQPQQPEPPPD